MQSLILLGTCDTKLTELLYLKSRIQDSIGPGYKVTLVDVGRSPIDNKQIDIQQDTLTTKYAPKTTEDVASLARGEVIKYMIACTSNWLKEAYRHGLHERDGAIHGVISAGGTGGTSLASSVMREVLPIGLPKLIVSTNASGDMGPVVGETDITMMYSVCDVSGLNHLLRTILSNAAGAIAGMARVYGESLSASTATAGENERQKRRVGLTMFGVTTPCVDKVREYLEAHYEIETFVFHCTGAGGRAMERLVEEGMLEAVLDVTTTEICDYICGGVMDAGPKRLEAALKAGIPYVVSVGATDMCNFGPSATVPERYQKRKLFEHNPTVTLMRTNEAECRAVGEFIVDKLTRFAKDREMVEVVLPASVSMIATPDGPFYDAAADQALFSTIQIGLSDSGIRLTEDPRPINDEGFAVDIAERLIKLMGMSNSI
ncbi:hypothetical protein LTR62_001097 [Meristemomyces frigidus]|uniref:Uncharacterized protein n=1 Tax=Meristemomyces frigidus TaxID=1508187 RepID=A0AAN7TGG6_9PEZI|nr:hypothetical protein LTR62_001097 [Meristemomyces frigidus]